MDSIHGTFVDGHIVAESTNGLVNGQKLLITPLPEETFEFMSEDAQANDPESIAKWVEQVMNAPAIQMSLQDEADLLQWQEEMKAFNLQAMRKHTQLVK